jgi:hypothetical protein
VGLDGAVRGRVGDAGEHEAVAHLVVIKERLVGLVDGTSLEEENPKSVSQVSSSFLRVTTRRFGQGSNEGYRQPHEGGQVLAQPRTNERSNHPPSRTSRTDVAHPTPTVSLDLNQTKKSTSNTPHPNRHPSSRRCVRVAMMERSRDNRDRSVTSTYRDLARAGRAGAGAARVRQVNAGFL